jgi:hypothetical protein
MGESGKDFMGASHPIPSYIPDFSKKIFFLRKIKSLVIN